MLALPVLAWGLGFVAFAGLPPRAVPASVRADGIVVLTGDSGRIARGLQLLRAEAGRRMLISGVSPGVRKEELAEVARVPAAVLDCCVDLGFGAVDTRSNAEETAAWARANNYRTLRLVTSDYHYRRARLELAAELDPGVRVLAEPVPAMDRSPGLIFAEYNKYLIRLAARGQERL